MLIEPLRTHKVQFFSSPSDLMKSTVVDESLSTTPTRVLFQRIYLITSRISRFWVVLKSIILNGFSVVGTGFDGTFRLTAVNIFVLQSLDHMGLVWFILDFNHQFDS